MTLSGHENRISQLEDLMSRLLLHAEATDRRIDRLADNQQLLSQDLRLLTARVDRLTERVDRLTEKIEIVADTVRLQAERDRNQAAIDRAEFRSTVQGILTVLTQRFNGNGHAEQ